MGIVKRLVKLIKADINGMIDHLEDPIDACKQAIRDMEQEVANHGERLKDTQVRYRQVAQSEEYGLERRTELDAELQACLPGADAALVRSIVRRKLEGDKRLLLLARQRAELDASIREIQQRLGEYEQRLGSVREKFECLTAHESPSTRGDVDATSGLWVSDEEVEVAIKQFQARAATNG